MRCDVLSLLCVTWLEILRIKLEALTKFEWGFPEPTARGAGTGEAAALALASSTGIFKDQRTFSSRCCDL